MTKALNFFLLITSFFATSFLFAQTQELKQLKQLSLNGDKQAFEKLIKLTKSNKTINYRVGRHHKRAPKGSLALLALTNVYCFTSDEIVTNNLESRKDFRTYFLSNLNQINYSNEYSYWYRVSLQTRNIDYKWKPLLTNETPKTDLTELDLSFLTADEASKIDSLLRINSSNIFVELSNCMFKRREFLLIENEILPIIKTLTGFELEVKNSQDEYVNHFIYDYYNIALCNYLSFWIQHHSSFTWNKSKNIFEASDIIVSQTTQEEILFDEMTSDNDSIALNAYKSLINSDLNFDYDYLVHKNVNRSLPIFWYKFMRVIKNIQDYENAQFLELQLSDEQQILAATLLKEISFKERYKAENLLIEKLDINTITAFELFALYNQRNDKFTQSAGRILDKFYSNSWETIISDNVELNRYLMKATQFDNLGIIGLCNNYVYKFEYCDKNLLTTLDSIKNTTSNKDIIASISRIKNELGSFESKSNWEPAPKDEYFTSYDQFIDELNTIHSEPPESDFSGYSYEYSSLLSKVPFELIGEIIDTLPYLEFSDSYNHWKYSFINIGYGIPIENLENVEIRTELKRNLTTLSKIELYNYYLKNIGINIWNSDSTLNYEKIYSILKYDLANGFVGNDSYRGFGVFGVIKLLELEFKTTLGYKEKSTNYTMSGRANLIQRTYDWRKYLLDHDIVKDDNKPISFLQRHGI